MKAEGRRRGNVEAIERGSFEVIEEKGRRREKKKAIGAARLIEILRASFQLKFDLRIDLT